MSSECNSSRIYFIVRACFSSDSKDLVTLCSWWLSPGEGMSDREELSRWWRVTRWETEHMGKWSDIGTCHQPPGATHLVTSHCHRAASIITQRHSWHPRESLCVFTRHNPLQCHQHESPGDPIPSHDDDNSNQILYSPHSSLSRSVSNGNVNSSFASLTLHTWPSPDSPVRFDNTMTSSILECVTVGLAP